MRFPRPLLAAAWLLPAIVRADEPVLRALIGRADLAYPAPVVRSEDGLPIGNGRMGSLVWTTPTSVRLQVNRVDVQPMDAATTSFFERNSDYMGGCAFADVDLGASGADVFAAEKCPQHLSVYDGLLGLHGRGVDVRAVALPEHDVFAIELDDERAAPQPLAVDLRMLRYASQFFGGELETMARDHIVAVRTREHVAASQLRIESGRIVLTQDFREGNHVAKSAVVAGLIGRTATARFANETTVSLAAPAANGRVLILIASAATLEAKEDVVAAAMAQLDAAIGRQSQPAGAFDALAANTAAWWHAFWARGALDLHSADGTAEYVAANYHYFLYLMAATSRGKYPPKFNGMLWNTEGDLRAWGAQHWFANLSCYYEALFASNRLELLDPMFDMYWGMYDACAVAARQQWGSEGIFIPETVWYDGPAKLPDDIAPELRDLYLLRKPWNERSARFVAYAATKNPHSSRWNFWGGGHWVEGHWVPEDRGFGPYGPVTHNLATTAKVAYLFWRRYEYTLDRSWLQSRAYPMLRGAAELYQHFPNLSRDAGGVVHIEHTNSNEGVLDVRDSDEDLSAMRGVLAAAIRASEILGIDAELRAQWRDLLAHLAPLPTSANPDAVKPKGFSGPEIFLRGREPVRSARGFTLDPNSLPQWFFDLANLDAPEPMRRVAEATYDRMLRGNAANASTPVGVLSKVAIAGAALGRPEATRFLVPNQMRCLVPERSTAYRGGQPMANRLSLREGPQAFDAQRLGRAAEALEIALLYSIPPAPSEAPTLRVFGPAWPAEWDGTFTLRARGGFVVSATRRQGRVETIEIISDAGAPLRLENPWGANARVVLRRNGAPAETVHGTVLEVPTVPGEHLLLQPAA